METQYAIRQLRGAVQLDDTWLVGERTGGKVGCSSENKASIVATASDNDQRHQMYVELNLVRGFTSEAISKWAKRNLVLGTRVRRDGLGYFSTVADAPCLYLPMVFASLKPGDMPSFKWVNTVLCNLKIMSAWAFHALNFRKCAEHYPAGFAYRFNPASI